MVVDWTPKPIVSFAANLLQKAAVGRTPRDEPDGAVGENTIDIKKNDFDLAGAVDYRLGAASAMVRLYRAVG